jgi:hypothetical protein
VLIVFFTLSSKNTKNSTLESEQYQNYMNSKNTFSGRILIKNEAAVVGMKLNINSANCFKHP